jgi:hypothetical protein
MKTTIPHDKHRGYLAQNYLLCVYGRKYTMMKIFATFLGAHD